MRLSIAGYTPTWCYVAHQRKEKYPFIHRMERSDVEVTCFAHVHNSKFPARARTRTARSKAQRTNHEATVALTWLTRDWNLFYLKLSKRTHRSLRPQETTATGNQFLSHLLWRQTTKKRFDNDRETLLRNKTSKVTQQSKSYQWTTNLKKRKTSLRPVS